MPIYDAKREKAVIDTAGERIANAALLPYYRLFIKKTMELSRRYQSVLLENTDAHALHADTDAASYPIYVKRGIINEAERYFDLDRKIFILTDSGVPKAYADAVKALCRNAVVYTVPEGEGAKCFAVYESVLTAMMESGIERRDAIIAVGGGVVSDIAAFCAATYMRGIDLYTVPTTVLAAVDASVGGKCAIDLGATKNTVGAFYHPRCVLIDPNVFATLDKRQVASGIAEAVKIAAVLDADLFFDIENGLYEVDTENFLIRAIALKLAVVEADEREGGLRRVLNFGHTVGHAVEIAGGLLHGEAVALGMIAMSREEARERLTSLLARLGLPTSIDKLPSDALALISRDKKAGGGRITVATCSEIGSFSFEELEPREVLMRLEEICR
jgi:3-dehydroquinate synthase